jgi:predicted ATPase
MNDITQPANSVFSHGSTWVRADFHMHTKADSEFTYSSEPNAFIASYVNAMVKAQIRVGVITNHNKFDRDEFKLLRKQARKEGVLLLPGVELSIKDGANGIHTLVVFSPDWIDNQENHNFIQNFLDVTFAGKANYENENGRSNHDMNDTVRELNKFHRDYFLTDCKSIEQIGKGQSTFLKIGALTFEAVKFALLDHANRVSSEPPIHTHSYIRSVSFEGAKLEETELALSPELNTFIGIRGSGKSSILESIRYALGIELPEKADSDEYKLGAVKHALGSGGKVTLQAVDRHGHEYEIRRILGEQPDVYVNGTLRPGINIRETVLYKPIYFGQKDLSSTGQGFENELVEKLVGDSLINFRHEIALKRQAVVETVRRLQKLSDVAEKQKEYQNRQADAEHRLKVFRQHGVEERLQKQVDFEQDSRALKGLTDFIDGYIDSLIELVAQYEDDFLSKRKVDSKRNAEVFNDVMAIFDRVAIGFIQIGQIIEQTRAASAEMKAKLQYFEQSKGALKEEFAEVARRLSEELKSSGATAVEPDEFLKLRKSIDNAKQMLVALGKEKDQQTTLQTQLTDELTALNDSWHEEFRLIRDRLEKINMQETALQIEIEYKGDKSAFLKYLKDMFRGSKLRETTLETLTTEYADGAAIYREMDKAKKTVGNSSETFEQYFRDNLTALLTWQVPNRFTIKYHGKQLKHHSLGQRASALILFVLSQREHDVVIIDQPEDDLDNQTIYADVIKLVRKIKPETQFIFATHNPNIPVLGDAEQVIACKYGDDRIETQVGSIDCPALQEAIVTIMEGGEEAFRERKRIYQVWKQQNS